MPRATSANDSADDGEHSIGNDSIESDIENFVVTGQDEMCRFFLFENGWRTGRSEYDHDEDDDEDDEDDDFHDDCVDEEEDGILLPQTTVLKNDLPTRTTRRKAEVAGINLLPTLQFTEVKEEPTVCKAEKTTKLPAKPSTNSPTKSPTKPPTKITKQKKWAAKESEQLTKVFKEFTHAQRSVLENLQLTTLRLISCLNKLGREH